MSKLQQNLNKISLFLIQLFLPLRFTFNKINKNEENFTFNNKPS
jgi:hypothetical protein